MIQGLVSLKKIIKLRLMVLEEKQSCTIVSKNVPFVQIHKTWFCFELVSSSQEKHEFWDEDTHFVIKPSRPV